MTHPRLVAVVSAVAASTAVFLVVSRWRLAGTITGAVLMPLIYTLVSHWSSQSLDHTAKWLRCRRFGGASSDDSSQPETEAPASVASEDMRRFPGASVALAGRAPHGGNRWTQWLLIGLASVAVGVSLYALTSQEPAERVIIRDVVVEKTITVTTLAQTFASRGSRGSSAGSSASTTLAAADDGTTTTTTAAAAAGLESSTSTSLEPVTTTTSLSDAPTTTAPPTTTSPTTAPQSP